MAIFRVGQRVRVVKAWRVTPGYLPLPNVGDEGTIVRAGEDWDYIVDIHGCAHEPTDLAPTQWGFDAWQLAPLTDPKADAFLESLKKLAREPVPAKQEA